MNVHPLYRRLPLRRRPVLAALATGALIVGAAALPSSASAAPGPTLYVATTGHDTGSCLISTAPCKTISYAVSQTSGNPSSTIKVAGGTYAEQVALNFTHTLTIIGGWVPKGAKAAPTVINPTTVNQIDTDPVHSNPYPIVDAAPGSTLNLQALTVEGSGASNTLTCGDDFLGVYYHNANGTMTNVTVDGIVLPTASFGCQDGRGIYVESDGGSAPNTSTVTMNALTVSNYDKNGIECRNAGTTCTVNNSRVKGTGPTPLTASNGIEAVSTTKALFTNNNVTGNSYTDPLYCPTGTCDGGSPSTAYTTSSGILVIDSVNATISGNKASANDGDIDLVQDTTGLGKWGVQNNSATAAVNNSGTQCSNQCVPVPFGDGVGDGLVLDGLSLASVTGNYGLNDVEYGIALYDQMTSSTVNTNTAKFSGVGFYVGGTSSGNSFKSNVASNNTIADGFDVATTGSSNLFQSNTANSNPRDGIRAESGTDNNSFTSNTLKNNLDYGARDLSTGGGTSGTANTWTTNTCVPANASSPGGLC